MSVRFSALALAASLCAGTVSAQTAEPFKIAFIDPLSGPFANVGEVMRNHVLYAVDDVNAKGGLYNGAKFQLLQFLLINSLNMQISSQLVQMT